MSTKFSSIYVSEVVKMATFSATSKEIVMEMTTFPLRVGLDKTIFDKLVDWFMVGWK